MTIWQPFQLFRHTNDAHLSNCFILETNACIFIITSRARLWWYHGLRTSDEEIAFTARPKINSHSQIFRYGRKHILPATSAQIFSDFFDLCLYWVSVVRALYHWDCIVHLLCMLSREAKLRQSCASVSCFVDFFQAGNVEAQQSLFFEKKADWKRSPRQSLRHSIRMFSRKLLFGLVCKVLTSW